MVRPLLAAEAGRSRRTAETQKAAEVAERYPGWTVWTARNGNARVATRGSHVNDPDDGVWAATLICDDWAQLEAELAVQAQADAARSYPEMLP
jgi:hypothetical protein